MMSKSAVIELTFNMLMNQVNLLRQQRNLSFDEMDFVLTKVLQEIRNARLVESADLIFKLSQQNETLEKEREKGNDKPDNQS